MTIVCIMLGSILRLSWHVADKVAGGVATAWLHTLCVGVMLILVITRDLGGHSDPIPAWVFGCVIGFFVIMPPIVVILNRKRTRTLNLIIYYGPGALALMTVAFLAGVSCICGCRTSTPHTHGRFKRAPRPKASSKTSRTGTGTPGSSIQMA